MLIKTKYVQKHVIPRLRILHILPKLTVAGAENMAGYLMQSLARSHDVSAISFYPASNSVIEQALERADIPIFHLDKRKGFHPQMYQAVFGVLRKFRPDVVHTHLSVVRYTLPSVLLRAVPVAVHTVHNMAEYEVDRLGRAIHKLAFHCGVRPVAISEEVARSIRRVYGLHAKTTIPNGIPVENYIADPEIRHAWRTKQGFSEDAILLMFVGRLERQKNPGMLLAAFARLADSRCHLVLVGDGDMIPQLQETARVAGIEDRVHFLGERRDVRECLAAADIFLLSSNWEGNPLSVMEAMASGLPVVATAVGGVPELVSGAGRLVAPGDCEHFEQCMRQLVADPSARRKLGSLAREQALSRFTVTQMAGAYERLYISELSGKTKTYHPAVKIGADGPERIT